MPAMNVIKKTKVCERIDFVLMEKNYVSLCFFWAFVFRYYFVCLYVCKYVYEALL